jgi:hypothetical protein
MTSSPKRPWFRFHLLTAVLLSLAAGSLIALQTKKFEVTKCDTYTCYGYPYF